MHAFPLMVFVVLGSTRLGRVVAAQANPAADGEPPRKILWQIGQLDGLSDHAGSPIAEAFNKETVAGARVRISVDRVREDFPRRIPPGQTIVLDLPELEMTDLLFRADTVTELKPDETPNDVPSLRILFNGKPIWTRRLYLESHMVSALIPASYLAPHNNTITLQSDGEKDVIFENASIETACAFRVPVHFYIRDWAKIPDAYRGDYSWNRDPMTEARPLRVPMHQKGDRSKWHTERNIKPSLFVGFNEQEKVARKFLDDTLGWYFNGGRSMRIEGMVGLGHFFCPYTKRPYPSAYALWTASRPFEGEAVRRLPINVLAGEGGGRGKTPGLVYWMATENSPEVASIIVVRHRYYCYFPGNKVRIVCALPWQGAAEAHVYNGIFPEDVFMDIPGGRGGNRKDEDPYKPYDRDRIDSVVNVLVAPNGQGGLLDIELDIQDCLIIRLAKVGAEPMMPAQHTQNDNLRQNDSQASINSSAVASVSGSREISDRLIKHFPIYEGVITYLSPNYRVRIGKATHGPSVKMADDVPEVEKSLFVDIDYTFGVPLTAEGAVLALYAFYERRPGRVLSFWVYPHTKTGGDPVPLRMGLGAWEGCVMLQPEKWQRVELHFANIAGLPTNHLVLLGPASDDSARRMDSITFEFNGIKLLEGPGTGN